MNYIYYSKMSLFFYCLGVLTGNHNYIFSRDVRVYTGHNSMTLSIDGFGTFNCNRYSVVRSLLSTSIVIDGVPYISYKPVRVVSIIAGN